METKIYKVCPVFKNQIKDKFNQKMIKLESVEKIGKNIIIIWFKTKKKYIHNDRTLRHSGIYSVKDNDINVSDTIEFIDEETGEWCDIVIDAFNKKADIDVIVTPMKYSYQIILVNTNSKTKQITDIQYETVIHSPYINGKDRVYKNKFKQ